MTRYAPRLVDINDYFLPSQYQRQAIILVIQSLTKPVLVVYQMYVVSKRMCRILIVKLILKKTVNMFERMEILETIYEGVLKPSYKNY